MSRVDHDDWPAGRISDRFHSIDQHLDDLREQLRVFAPMARTIGELTATVEDIEEDVSELKVDVKELVNRSVTLRIVIVAAPIVLTCVGILLALLTNHLG